MNYYNEYDKKAAAWLRELIVGGFIPEGQVDERSITEITPEDINGYDQCHFFAGIGGWAKALRLAGAEGVSGIWTGSCPCQPFSVAGKQKGTADERHLWPVWFELIQQCRPERVFGEQVEAAIRHGWIDGVQADLEAEGYAVGYTVLGAHSVGYPHIRKRLFFGAKRLENASCLGWGGRGDGDQAGNSRTLQAEGSGGDCGLAYSIGQGPQGRVHRGPDSERETVNGYTGCCGPTRWILCRDGKHRRVPVEPSLFPLADGLPGRVGLLRGAGNAIVPEVAAAFIVAFNEQIPIIKERKV